MDVKEGNGKLTYEDGTTIEGVWENNNLNGCAQVKRPGKKLQIVIFRDGLLIEHRNRSDCDKSYLILSLICQIGFFGLMFLHFATDYCPPVWLSWFTPCLYLLYMIRSCTHKATKEIFNT